MTIEKTPVPNQPIKNHAGGQPKVATTPAAPKVANTTEATTGEPLAMRAKARRAELQAAHDKLPASDKRGRDALAVAIAAVDGMLTGDTAHLTDATAADLNRWLEGSKHLAEPAAAPPRAAH